MSLSSLFHLFLCPFELCLQDKTCLIEGISQDFTYNLGGFLQILQRAAIGVGTETVVTDIDLLLYFGCNSGPICFPGLPERFYLGDLSETTPYPTYLIVISL